jgi:hypothetical protein
MALSPPDVSARSNMLRRQGDCGIDTLLSLGSVSGVVRVDQPLVAAKEIGKKSEASRPRGGLADKVFIGCPLTPSYPDRSGRGTFRP